MGRNNFHWIETNKENNWFPTSKQIEDKVKNLKNKNILMILNSPNNPAGSNCKNFEDIASVAKENGIIIKLKNNKTNLNLEKNINLFQNIILKVQ